MLNGPHTQTTVNEPAASDVDVAISNFSEPPSSCMALVPIAFHISKAVSADPRQMTPYAQQLQYVLVELSGELGDR
jgi:hypothetical protein